MNILFLLSEEDRANIPSAILVENVTLRSDPDIQTELLLNDYDTCFITSNYTKVYGTLTVKNIIKTFNLMTSIRIHYLIKEEYEVETDEIIPFLIDLNIGNITQADIMKLELKEFQQLAKMSKSAIGMVKSKKRLTKERLRLIKDELSELTDDRVSEYMRQNKGRLLDLIQSNVELLVENEVAQQQVQNLYSNNQYLDRIRLENIGIIQSLKAKNRMLNKDIRSLRNSVMEYKDRIDDYNSSVLDSRVTDYPIVYLDDLTPPIIYFKEIEDIGFYNVFQSLIYTFSEIYKVYTKSIILERSNRHFYNPYERDGYVTVNNDSKMEILINNDKLLRYGNPTDVLKTISKPEFRTELILIYDRVGTEDILVDAPYIQPYYIGNYRETLITLDIDDNSWISPYEGDWSNIKQLLSHKGMGEDERIVYNALVSQHPLIKNIVDSSIEPLDEDY